MIDADGLHRFFVDDQNNFASRHGTAELVVKADASDRTASKNDPMNRISKVVACHRLGFPHNTGPAAGSFARNLALAAEEGVTVFCWPATPRSLRTTTDLDGQNTRHGNWTALS